MNRTCTLPFPAHLVVLVRVGVEGTGTLELLSCRGIQVGICTCRPFPPCSRSSRKSADHHVSYRALQPPPHLPGRSVIGLKGIPFAGNIPRRTSPELRLYVRTSSRALLKAQSCLHIVGDRQRMGFSLPPESYARYCKSRCNN